MNKFLRQSGKLKSRKESVVDSMKLYAEKSETNLSVPDSPSKMKGISVSVVLMSESSSASFDINDPDDSLGQSSHSSFMTQSNKNSSSDSEHTDTDLCGFKKKAYRVVK